MMKKKAFKSLLLTTVLGSSMFAFNPVTSAQENNYPFDTYPVAKGDSLYRIAKTLGLTSQELLEFNGLNSTIIFPGQELAIPPMGDSFQEKGVYTVSKGDSLYTIAKRLKTTVTALKAKNNLTSNYIYPGQILYAPSPGETKNPAPVSGNFVYTVAPGDNLFHLARVHKTSVEAIKAINGLKGNLLFPGQKLIIDNQVDDGSMPTPPPARTTQTHTVIKGDTLYSIAKQYGTTVFAIQRDNSLDSTHLNIGQQLTILK